MIVIDKPCKTLGEDLFGFAPDATSLADSIMQSNERGYVVGVFGPWGSGKSSFMNFMACQLQEHRIPCVEFCAWQYDRYESLLAALVDEMARQRLAHSRSPKRKELAYKLRRSAVALGSLAAAHATGGIICPETVEQLTGIWSGSDTSRDVIAEFKSAFSKFSRELGGRARLPVVVFLDDLDRCLPSSVVAILDALRLLLLDSNCVFVVGVDREVVEHAVSMRYGNSGLPHGRAYLDKIMDVQVHIPAVPTSLLEHGLLADQESQALSVEERQILFSAAEGNPRRMLRLLNALSAIRQANRSGIDDSCARLAQALTVALRIAFPNCYAACLASPDKAANAFHQLAEQSADRQRGITTNGLEAYEGLLKDGRLTAFLRANGKTIDKHFGTGEARAILAKVLLTGRE